MKSTLMEIGQKTTQKTTKIDSYTNNSSLAIHINESWVVFCLFNHQKLSSLNKVRFLHKKKSNFVLKTIKKYIKSFSKENIPSEVKLIYYNKTSTLVPSTLFDHKNSLNYLKYNTSINIDDIAANDQVLNHEINNVYIPNTEINNFIFEKFRTFDFFHYSSLIIDKISNELAENFSEKVFININDGFIDILFFKDKKLMFYNSYDYNSDEDILFYLLFCFSELKLNPDKIHTVFSGSIDLNSKLYELIYTYVRNVELIDTIGVDGIDFNVLNSNILLSEF